MKKLVALAAIAVISYMVVDGWLAIHYGDND